MADPQAMRALAEAGASVRVGDVVVGVESLRKPRPRVAELMAQRHARMIDESESHDLAY